MEQVIVDEINLSPDSNHTAQNGFSKHGHSNPGLTMTWENINVYLSAFNSSLSRIKTSFSGSKTDTKVDRMIINNGIAIFFLEIIH